MTWLLMDVVFKSHKRIIIMILIHINVTLFLLTHAATTRSDHIIYECSLMRQTSCDLYKPFWRAIDCSGFLEQMNLVCKLSAYIFWEQVQWISPSLIRTMCVPGSFLLCKGPSKLSELNKWTKVFISSQERKVSIKARNLIILLYKNWRYFCFM